MKHRSSPHRSGYNLITSVHKWTKTLKNTHDIQIRVSRFVNRWQMISITYYGSYAAFL